MPEKIFKDSIIFTQSSKNICNVIIFHLVKNVVGRSMMDKKSDQSTSVVDTAIPRLVRSPKSANSISASLGLLVRVPVPFTTYILPRLVRIRLVRMPFFWNALLALTEELLYIVTL